MRTINKGSEPRSLTDYRRTFGCNYHDYNDKDTLRSALVKEQRGICCYCLSRIRDEANNVKIEHWESQSEHPECQLDYDKLLAACLGGKKERYKKQHCDTRKGDAELKWNPANPHHQIESHIYYDGDGMIFSDDHEFNVQINEVLNLNLARFCNYRKVLFDETLKWWKSEVSTANVRVARTRLERKREKFINGTNDLVPFCQVAIYLLDQKIAELQS